MSIAAECGLSLWRCQIEVEVSCQVFEPHWWVFWKQGLTASQLLLQVPNIQLKRTRQRKYHGCIFRNNTAIIQRWDCISACDSVLSRCHNAVLFLCVYTTIFMGFRGFTKPITFIFSISIHWQWSGKFFPHYWGWLIISFTLARKDKF